MTPNPTPTEGVEDFDSARELAPNTSAATEKDPLPPGAQFYDFKPGAPILTSGEVRDYGYRVGHIITKLGVVGFYDQGRTPRYDLEAHTSMDFVVAGRCYRASWPRTFSDRFLKTLAQRFIASVAREHSSPQQVPQPIREDL